MQVKLILPALLEAHDPGFRPIKYSLFPPLGLATLAAYLHRDDAVSLIDEHVMPLHLDDRPDLVVMSVYVTSARRAYEIADHYRSIGTHVALGGLHVTSLPEEAALHADSIFIGPAEECWPRFLADFRRGEPGGRYESTERTLIGAPLPRRDLIDRRRYLCPNSLVVSRGCPGHCDFCYKDAFYGTGRSFYTSAIDRALAEIESLPGRHLYFLDDHLFGNPRFAAGLFEGIRGVNRVFQGAGTVASILQGNLIERAAEAGMRSIFVGFESVNQGSLIRHRKRQDPAAGYDQAIDRVHSLGIMVNASFVFGLDGDGPDVFDRTVDWAVSRSLETATFHILTPYPGTALRARLEAEGRVVDSTWDRYDTRHVVYVPRGMSADQLTAGYRRAYSRFYSWRSIFGAAAGQESLHGKIRHLMYAGGWKKFEPLWDAAIRCNHVSSMLPLLESTLDAFGRARGSSPRSAAAAESWRAVRASETGED